METDLRGHRGGAGVMAPNPMVRILGIGTAGSRLVQRLVVGREGGLPVTVLLPPWDEGNAADPGLVTLRIRGSWQPGWTAAGDPDQARSMAEEEFGKLVELSRGAEWVVLIAGLGGGAGSGMSPVVARAAREAGARVLAIVVTPFHWEGDLRQRRARASLEELRSAADGLVCVPNQKFLPLLPPRTPLLEAYEQVNRVLTLGLEAFWDALTQRGLIPLPLENLCELLRGRHAESLFLTAEAQGEDRVQQLRAALSGHPLVEEGRTLEAATSVFVHVTAGPDLAAAEVDELVREIQGRAPRAEILVGAGLQPHWEKRVRLMLLVTRRGQLGGNGTGAGKLSRSLPDEAGSVPDPESGHGPDGTPSPVPLRGWSAPGGDPGQRGAVNGELPTRNQGTRPSRVRGRLQQGTLPLDVTTRGRFEKTEPNIHRGEDLDVPTFLRRGLVLE